jgi:anti-sigma B factor antagonist
MRRRSLPITESTTTNGLTISVIGSEGGTVVCLSGRFSIDSSPDVRDRLLAIFDQASPPTLTIDLGEVTYMDSSGLATLVEALKTAHDHKTLLRLRGLQDRPRYLLEVAGLLRLFETYGRTNGSSVRKVL